MRYVVPDLSVEYFRKDLAKAVLAGIDDYAVKTYDGGFRKHLGASVVGAECTRATWYGWRWMTRPKKDGRMQRLFQRGHLEEFRYAEYLRGIGATLYEHDPNLPLKDGKPQQFKVSKIGGHFGGSLDGIVQLTGLGLTDWMLVEFKTKGAGKDEKSRSFDELCEKGIMRQNPQHYDQMCTYGAAYQLPYALYMSTNKHDERMHVEVLPLDWNRAAEVESKAAFIVRSQVPPPRISLNPTHYKCKGCDFLGVCHHNQVPAKNCRSCQYGNAADGAMWYCTGHGCLIPDDVVPVGCPQWDFIKSPPG
jgi:hypothetical protein